MVSIACSSLLLHEFFFGQKLPSPHTSDSGSGRILLSTRCSHLTDRQPTARPRLVPEEAARWKRAKGPQSLLLWRRAGWPGPGAPRPGDGLEAAGARLRAQRGAKSSPRQPRRLCFRTVTALWESYSVEKKEALARKEPALNGREAGTRSLGGHRQVGVLRADVEAGAGEGPHARC